MITTRKTSILFSTCWFIVTIFIADKSHGQNNPYYQGNHISSEASLSVVLLMDASGSMKENDPTGIRRAAAQVLISLLPLDSKVAVVEFGNTGRVLVDDQGNKWLGLDNKQKVIDLIQSIGESDNFTDFQSGLKEALIILSESPANRRRIVVLLSDGILEPYVFNDDYAPYQYLYQKDIINTNSKKRRQITEKYIERLRPIAIRKIEDEILPQMLKQKIEIFTVALSAKADREFLQYLANSTSLDPTQVHYFYEEKATDLINIFAQLAQYWTDLTVFHVSGGITNDLRKDSIYVDEFMEDPRIILSLNGLADFYINAKSCKEKNEKEIIINNVGLYLHYLDNRCVPGTFYYGFNSGECTYKTIMLAKNKLFLKVTGIRAKYDYGDSIDATIELIFDGKNAIEHLLPPTIISTNIYNNDGILEDSALLEITQDNFNCSFKRKFTKAGKFNITFTAFANNKSGQDILPRPSLRFQCEVLPKFYVEPNNINFGSVSSGVAGKKVIIHSGLAYSAYIYINGTIISSSSSIFKEENLNRFPTVVRDSFFINPGEQMQYLVQLLIPQKVAWGDHTGKIMFYANKGEFYQVNFRIHIPSIWEKIRLPILGLIILLIGIFSYLIYIWGYLGTPYGVLSPLSYPSGEIITDIKLSRIKRNLLSRWFNWKRNIISIAKSNSDIKLNYLPSGLRVEISFYMWGGIFAKNSSKENTSHTIAIENEYHVRTERGINDSLSLQHNDILEIGNYRFKFLNRTGEMR